MLILDFLNIFNFLYALLFIDLKTLIICVYFGWQWLITLKHRTVGDMDGYQYALQLAREKYFGINWSTVLGLLIVICITTRFVTGLQSRRNQASSLDVPVAPYWFPWIGHGPAFLWNHVSFFKSTRFVFRAHISSG